MLGWGRRGEKLIRYLIKCIQLLSKGNGTNHLTTILVSCTLLFDSHMLKVILATLKIPKQLLIFAFIFYFKNWKFKTGCIWISRNYTIWWLNVWPSMFAMLQPWHRVLSFYIYRWFSSYMEDKWWCSFDFFNPQPGIVYLIK